MSSRMWWRVLKLIYWFITWFRCLLASQAEVWEAETEALPGSAMAQIFAFKLPRIAKIKKPLRKMQWLFSINNGAAKFRSVAI